MECQNCHQPVEAGAAYCGNCGHALHVGGIALAGVYPSLPSYALATPAARSTETKLLLALLCGVAGLIGALFVPLAGVTLGIAGIVAATTTRSVGKHWPVRVGLGLSCLALLAGLGTWVYAVKNDPRFNHNAAVAAQSSAPATVSADLATPCYSANFIDRLNVSHVAKSCNMNAYNGQSLNASSNAYKVYASQAQIINVSSFTNLAKTALEKDVKNSLPSFSIDSERVSGFAGSPAYTINASDKAQGVAIVETAVYHPVKTGDDIFILVHAIVGSTTDLHILEAGWQWK